jgi:uncharacterized NAD(P)/FAD-binding protein YdhS
MADENIRKITMITKYGLFKWKVMPFKLKNPTRTFSRTMANVFKDWIDQFLKIFVEDVNVHRNDWRDHLNHLRMVFDKLKLVNLKLNAKKMLFWSKGNNFYGTCNQLVRV